MNDAATLEQDNWLAHTLAHDGRLNLLCFPYAGGSSAIFTRWRLALPAWINVCPLVFPGREGQHRRPKETDFRTLAEKVAEALLPQLPEVNFAIYGHSMGAWFAHDLALRASQRGFAPRALLVSGQRAPQFAYPFNANREMDDTTLLKFISSFGGLDAELLANKAWVSWMLEIVRADLSLCESHAPVRPEITLPCPVHLFANDTDPLVDISAQRPWKNSTTGQFSTSLHEGGHFFIRTHASDFLKKLGSVLEQLPLSR
ncbi:MAG: alpha/beta fold hydrolase [Rouxiella badensis]|jgi:medium-chain acyl-[acyl-carrier-protein] hydrolase|uniref:thioesterase II family protein n=1 Tax=Rouxiella badensis TaxID=1646377 RepID=UPI001D13B5FB|nr:alpha/beta fold hydrolase [Rouxiella badensis]MCC3721453.1 hypothetical protein [Rouxiella badensis]MCC3731018.1 hypothetical protein [Rouxiella badensis]MCC3742329.1 hypothetical protein [Rouxiella badensis]